MTEKGPEKDHEHPSRPASSHHVFVGGVHSGPQMGGLHETNYVWRQGPLVMIVGGTSE